MREYEMTVIYDLAVAEAGGQEASVEAITQAIESRSGKILKVDHWGRRRMAYPIRNAIDGDYIILRFELDPSGVSGLEAGLKIDERVYRQLVVRADELPVPLPPREPRREPVVAQPVAAAAAPAEAPPPAPAAPAEAPPPAPAAPAAAAPEASAASPEPAPAPEPTPEPAAAAEAPAAATDDTESAPPAE
jgi:ribosomal protein S6